ncbi:helix-turn-helix domain-containing protein [Bifidobacterium tibiigranuli]|uniref:helix-turn-helix domain-containing protein n=1 Tax=Bifidobacterium tibiigranuli TaxID=2172043 RepID=UPI0026F15F6E|nr:helix-turn-helix domain-containing protein [Bifidobacterium tibiigranuli]MCI1649146.1 helix-turn-helix domain-containing protein [Bifidobacterium tibiigranuli]MCI2185564.1 helix-turn-helix domain-containing protein [Bifidobacterium tibiigranuli]MCI2203461.1 helix-turn-helix domain-containing protein [Bifidobacterium tibiigranuli]
MDNEKWEVFFMPDDLRSRYDELTRKRAAELFGLGYGTRATATALSIPRSTVRKWRRTFLAVGLEGLLSMGSKPEKYTWEQKCAAAKAVVDEGATKADAMARFGIASSSPLEKWCRLYRDGGDEALRPKPKGRPKGSVSRPRAPLTREQKLEEKVRRLEAENAYLKKLAALRAARESRTGIRPPL